VQGHVDGVGKLTSVQPHADSYLMEFEIPARLARYCVEKGSIALNGVSLTINGLKPSAEGCRVAITLIPHTWEHTQFQDARPGDPVHVEVDVLAKYVESLTRSTLSQ
jgi:riboflavin synthase